MSARRLLIMLTAVGGILITPVAAHAAGGYPIDPPASSVSDGTIPAGEAVIFSGKGFLAGEPISIDVTFKATGAALHTTKLLRPAFVEAAFKTVIASATGTFSTPLELNQTGTAILTATGTISGVVVNEQVVVVVAQAGAGNPAGPGGQTLPTTGQSGRHWANEIGLGLGAVLIGGLLLFGTIRLRGRNVRQT